MGLAGFALACVFRLMARFSSTDRLPQLPSVAIAMAVVALVCLGIESRHEHSKAEPKISPPGRPGRKATRSRSPLIVDPQASVSLSYGSVDAAKEHEKT
jgi:hypothetical protein